MRLDHRAARREHRHHAEPGHRHQRQRQPEILRKGKPDQPRAEQRRSPPGSACRGRGPISAPPGSTPPRQPPCPAAPIRKPSVCGPPCRIFEANTGIKTVYGTPMKLMIANSSITVADRRKRRDIRPALLQLPQHAHRRFFHRLLRDPHRQQRGDHREIAHPVDQETPSLADGRDGRFPPAPGPAGARR